jgi:hypothetical protein
MNTCGGAEKQPLAFVTSALDGGEWSASRPGRFTLEERATEWHLKFKKETNERTNVSTKK